MLDLNNLQVKKAYYLNLISDLKDKNISEEVEKRLAPERERLEKEIKTEIEEDITKCNHYVELLDTLIKTELETEEKLEENVEDEETITQENIIESENVDPFQVRPEV